MKKKTTVRKMDTHLTLDPKIVKALRRIGKQKGGVKLATMVRVGLADYIAREGDK
ncbi:MAG TPA: hypothetical protein VGS20_07490 [Candidatus Acidoferrales bacterium]|nr:hypothetical protein [Candidatus Acidoferrales bacterium]